VAAGYFGKSSDKSVKLHAGNHAAGKKVHSLEVKGVHLCCGKCVSAVNDAVTSVAGVKGTTAAKGVESFTVTGDFNDAAVFAALQKAGLAGRAK
jgi:copper chaperone CopZ